MSIKLKNSLQEQYFRDVFIGFKEAILEAEDKVIISFLEKSFGKVNSLYCLVCTPGQGEYLYSLLLNGSLIVSFWVSTVDNSIYEVEIELFKDYLKIQGRSRIQQIEIQVLLDLLEKEKIHY